MGQNNYEKNPLILAVNYAYDGAKGIHKLA